MERSDASMSGTVAGAAPAERVTAFLRKVYGWMFFGLGITALVAYGLMGTPGLVQSLVANHLVFLALFAAQIGLVFFLSARVDRIAPSTAAVLFVIYSALTGVTFSVLLLAYTGALDHHHLRGDGRDVRRSGRLRHHHHAEPRRRGPVLLHGPGGPHPGVDRGDVLEQ